MRVLVVGDEPQAVCVGALLCLDGNEAIFASGDALRKRLSQGGVKVQTRGQDLCLDAPVFYRDADSAGMFDLVLCGMPSQDVASQKDVIRRALAHDSVIISLPSSSLLNEMLCRTFDKSFVVHCDATVPVSIDNHSVYVLHGIPRMTLEEPGDGYVWALDYISAALNSADIRAHVISTKVRIRSKTRPS